MSAEQDRFELWAEAKKAIDYRPIHAYTMSNDVGYIEPKARVY
jgi:hypothetical protein